jgi:phenylacetate-coenzyme A ligase PaaK-like adenylate-forming protein
MNQFYNPLFLLKVLKSYLFDINRLHLMDEQELRRYQDRCVRHIVKFAYTVPLYHDLYRKAKVHPQDISGVEDLSKLPEVSKEDIAKYYPDGIVSSTMNRENLIQVSTSGTTGKSLSIYVDLYDIILGLFGYLRQFREYNINWRKHRITIIGDFAPHTVESGYINRGIEPGLTPGFYFTTSSGSIQMIHQNNSSIRLTCFNPIFLADITGCLVILPC